jgi:hypothetical protein
MCPEFPSGEALKETSELVKSSIEEPSVKDYLPEASINLSTQGGVTWSASSEPPEQTKSRLKIKERTATFNLIKESILLLSGLSVTLAIAFICVRIIISKDSTPDDKKWATSYLTLIAGFILGYLFHRGGDKDSDTGAE